MSGQFPAHSGDADVISLIEEQFERIEERFSRLKAETRQAMQFSIMGSAAAIWAHEFNNLVTPILNLSRVALQRQEPQYTEKSLQIIASNAETLIALSERILNLAARNELPKPARVQLSSAVQHAIDALGRDLAKDRISVHIDVPEEFHVWLDPHSLQQILFNLILNARAALVQGGGGRLILQAARSNDRLCLTIQDTGVGMDAAQLEQLFDPFKSTRRVGHGNGEQLRCGGIGLALCRDLVEESDGALSVESQRGKGTTFRVHLPEAKP